MIRKTKGSWGRKPSESQSSMELGVPKQKPKYKDSGFIKDIRTREDADRLKGSFQRMGYHVKLQSYVVAHQRWWRISFKR